jgi:dUTP pyrophosphatase
MNDKYNGKREPFVYPKPEINTEYFTPIISSQELDDVEIARLDEHSYLPSRKHKTDAGIDFYTNQGITIEKGEVGILTTGIAVKIPEGYAGLVWPKSGSNYLIGGGVIDSGYRGEIFIKVINTSGKTLVFEKGDAVAQLLIQPIVTPKVKLVSEEEFLSTPTERGDSGGVVNQYKSATIVSKITDIEE